jgi:hypothetical protein
MRAALGGLWPLGVMILAILAASLIWPDFFRSSADRVTPSTVDTVKSDSYGAPVEKKVVLSDGRQLICLQSSYGGLWCTP